MDGDVKVLEIDSAGNQECKLEDDRTLPDGELGSQGRRRSKALEPEPAAKIVAPLALPSIHESHWPHKPASDLEAESTLRRNQLDTCLRLLAAKGLHRGKRAALERLVAEHREALGCLERERLEADDAAERAEGGPAL